MRASNRFPQLVSALSQLDRALAEPKSEFLRDSAIQRFEFVADLAWKTLQEVLGLDYGLRPNSPKSTFRHAHENELIPDLMPWFQLIEDRNLTSHTYDVDLAEKIYSRLPAHAALVHDLIARLEDESRRAA